MSTDSDKKHAMVEAAAKAIQEVRAGHAGIPIVLTGKIVNGKVILDQHVLDEIQKNHPNANGSFIAVNAPFDPVSPAQ